MEEISIGRTIAPSVTVFGITTALALVLTNAADIDGSGLPAGYVIPAIGVSIFSIVIWMALALITMAVGGVRSPGRVIVSQLSRHAEMLLLPTLIQPLFFAAFTAAKTSIAPLVSFTWDGFYTRFDAAIFGGDPWRLTHAAIGPIGSLGLEFFYTAVWGVSLVFVQAFMAIYATRRAAGTFFLALNLTWLVGGILLAYVTPAAGPVFAHLFDPALSGRFAELRSALALYPEGPVFQTQDYLADMLGKRIAEEGGGISAMPSMHVATAMIYVLAARRTRWFWPAIVFTVLTCIGSVHFGYHYAVDGLVAIAIAGLCWRGAEMWFGRSKSVDAPEPGIAGRAT
ncbi:phosphatase PAP2 family protein [Sphingobium boeckii]|uniref:Inositolphosphotransferase Aur1/Ipt1 domain-containing protein n=1 Tax=Sphingobium boeckii TaxID=1082345 RepID=A0A7W9EGT0_9SPHN|nr:phosphatase PAP2 family protein [Sphingobium boeckii]MBB5687425.1 hypothetical protein [Sphingobium boeckii]